MFVTAVWPVVWLLEHSVTGLMSWGELWQGKGPEAEKTEAAELQEVRARHAQARTY
jgi:hypothetical protein